MFHVKRRHILGFFVLASLFGVLLTGCIRDTSRGWAGPVTVDQTQVVSVSKGKLDGIDMRADPPPAWTGTLSLTLAATDKNLQSASISPSDTPFQGDLVQIDSELVRVRSLTINGAERELHLDRGYGGTTAAAHQAGAKVSAVRRAWRFPDDWHIGESKAKSLKGIYANPVLGSDGVMYVGDYSGWLYAFKPGDVNLDAANDNQEPATALVNLGDKVIGGAAIDSDTGLLYVTAGRRLFAVSTDRLKAALSAGGGLVQAEAGFSFQAGDDLWGAPLISDGVVYVTSLDGGLYALDAATGSAKWTYKATKGLTTTPVIAGDVILVGGFDSTLFAVSKSNGQLAWSHEGTNWIFSTPVLDGNSAYYGDFDGILHSVNVQTGDEEWSLALNRGKIRASVAFSGNFVVLGTDEGWLIGVNEGTQQRAWEVDLGHKRAGGPRDLGQ